MNRSRSIVAAGVAAGLLANYWVLEGVLAKRSDLAASWISDLAARSEAYGWRFETFEIVSGVAVIVFALLLLPGLGQQSPMLRRGVIALAVAGAMTVADGAAPLSCAESLDKSCSLRYDAVDIVHAASADIATIAGALAFIWIWLGLARLGRRQAARATLAIGAVWIVLNAATALVLVSTEVDSIKGLLQRSEQVLFGIWLVLLAIWAGRAPQSRTSPLNGASRPVAR